MAIKNVVRLISVPSGSFLELSYLAMDGITTDPVGAPDGSFWYNATEKQYKAVINGAIATVSTSATGGDWAPVRLASAASIAASATYSATTLAWTFNAVGSQSVNGVATVLGDRIGLKSETAGNEKRNGIYTVSAKGTGSVVEVWTRAPDANVSGSFVDGKAFAVAEGTLAGTVWYFTNDSPFTLDTTAVTFARQTGVMLLDSAQTNTAAKTFSNGTLKINNAADTFASTLISEATAARAIALQDAGGKVPIAATVGTTTTVLHGNAAAGSAGAYGAVVLTTDVSGTLPIANGGTNATAAPTAGGLPYGTGTAYAFMAAGAAGEVVTSNGAGAPTWGAAVQGLVKRTVTVPFNHASFVASTDAEINVGAVLPANARLMGWEFTGFTGFQNAGDTITVAVELGTGAGIDQDSVATSLNIRVGQTGFPKTGTAGVLAYSMASYSAAQIIAKFTGGGNLNTLTAGAITINFFYIPLA